MISYYSCGKQAFYFTVKEAIVMRAKRISRDEQFQLIMECRRSGLSDYQLCEANGVLPGTFYMWVIRLKKAGYAIPDTAAGTKSFQSDRKQFDWLMSGLDIEQPKALKTA